VAVLYGASPDAVMVVRGMITQKELEQFLLSLPDVLLDHPFDKQTAVYKVGDAMFALVAEKSDPVRVSLRCDPQLAVTLRERYETVLPGHHLNKKYWNTIILTGQLDRAAVQDLIRHSYQLVAGGTL
jgi:predicted DNA-binding protein (MmcQ/YjbR family)